MASLFQSKDEREVRELYETAKRLHKRLKLDPDVQAARVITLLSEHTSDDFPLSFIEPFGQALSILAMEEHVLDEPDQYAGRSMAELSAYRKDIRARLNVYESIDEYLSLFDDFLLQLFKVLADQLPAIKGPSPFEVPVVNLFPNPKGLIQGIVYHFSKEPYRERGMFAETREQIGRNLFEASGYAFTDDRPNKRFKEPDESTLPVEEIAKAYLKGTVFELLLLAPVPLKLSNETRFGHMHIVGGTGAGKTTLLENLILHDLQGDAAIVVVDSQGDLIRKLSTMQLPAHRGDPILITPKDVQHPPALNVFDVNRDRLEQYDQATREQVIAGVIQTFDYLFSGLIGADLSAKQSVFFRYIARLMLALPNTLGRNATILDMLRLMEDATPYQTAIKSLPPIQREFFERDFAGKGFTQTREQIRYRLHAIIENPTLARLFTSPSTQIDLFRELNKGSVILVDTAKDFLKGSSAHFGQIFISLVLQATLERAAIPEHERHPAFLIVDEAAEYFDSNIDDLLTEARKHKLGCVFAHQYLGQATSELKASFAANTTIKMAGGVSMGDARSLAPDMRTEAHFIFSQPRLHFAAHIRNVTPEAVSLPVEIGQLDRQPKRRDYDAFIQRNRARVFAPPEPEWTNVSPPASDEPLDFG